MTCNWDGECQGPATVHVFDANLCEAHAHRCEFCPDHGDDCLAEVTWENDMGYKFRLCKGCAKKAESQRRAYADWESRGDYAYDMWKDEGIVVNVNNWKKP